MNEVASMHSESEKTPEKIPGGPEMVTLVELDQLQINAIVQSAAGEANNVQCVYPLSPLQDGMLFHHVMNEDSDTYVLSILFELESHEKVGLLVNALQKVINRHEVLRSAILWEKVTRPVQVVYRQATLPVEELVLDQGHDPIDQLKQHMSRALRGFDLRKAPLLRLQVAAEQHGLRWYALLRVHHLICDHQSLNILVAEAMACIEGRENDLCVPAEYRDYVARTLANTRPQEAEAFFRRKLGGFEEPAAPFGLFQMQRAADQVKETRRALDPMLAEQARMQSRRFGVSAARLFHAAWGLLVARTSGRNDVVFGTIMLSAQRRAVEPQRSIGMFVNTLPLRLRLKDVTVKDLLEQTDSELRDLRNHEAAPLTLALRSSGIADAAPLFTSLLNYRRSNSNSEPISAKGIGVLARSDAWTNYPITLMVDDLGDGFLLTVRTDGRIDPQRVMGYLHTIVQSLVKAMDEAPQTQALALSMLPEAERRDVIEVFNSTQAPYPQDKVIHELLEEQVERTPEAEAVVYDGQSLTYAELNAKANQLARYLRERGVAPDRLVALYVERGAEMLVGLLGILKAGGAYVPLNTTDPRERLEHLLADAAPRVLLTQERLKSRLPAIAAEVIALDGDSWQEIAQQSKANLNSRELQLSPRHLAYVIYTSGSTGKPKGVMVEHRNIVNYAVHALRHFDVASGSGSLICTSFSFDLMLTGLYPVLLCGRTVRLCREERGLPALAEEVRRADNLAPLKLTPSHLALLDQPLRAGQLAGRIRVLVLGGEPLRGKAVEPWRAHAPGTRIFNHYGPTETTVGCVAGEIGGQVSDGIPIGRPISNTQIYILDEFRQPAPIGVSGEIYVGGAGVARGYLNRPELTAERFPCNPFSADPQARLYKTGDQGRWRADGTIEYLGRNDDQVKIRGHRIELGEIEAHLVRHKQVKEAVAIAREDAPNDKRLVAYITLCDESRPSAEELRAHLQATLPEYMVPSAFVILDALPLTPNGKLDRRALPVPEMHAGRQYETPQGEVEEVLAGIWQSLLPVERVGRHDNFFELGGHSLLIVQMIDRLCRVGLPVEVRRVFENPTLKDLAHALKSEMVSQVLDIPPNLIPSGCTAISPQMLTLVELQDEHIERIVELVPGGAANIQDIYPLTPLQEGILFHHRLLTERGGDTYVVVRVLSVPSRERLDELIAALQAVIDHHDILRTAVLWEQLPQPVQVVYRHATLIVEDGALDQDRSPADQIDEWIRPERQRLDPRRAPLIRLQVATDREGRWYALLQTHHVALDHMTFGILIDEVVAHLEGRVQALPKAVPYRNHVAHALAYSRTGNAEAFFRAKLADVDEPTAPFGLMDVRGDGSRIEEVHQGLELHLARRVRAQARRLEVSSATLFHAAWALAIACTSGRSDVVFGTVLLGRLQGNAGAERMLGISINTLPLRLALHDISARELVERTQRELVELLGHEQASLAIAQRCSGVVGSTPLFTALFNYRHSSFMGEVPWSSAGDIKSLHVEGRTNYPITLSVDDLGEDFALTSQTDRRVDARRMMAYMCTAVQSLVEALEDAPQTPALALSILPESERRQVTEVFNATRSTYPQEKLIHELLEEQVKRTPDAVAVMHEGRSLTYAELNRLSNQLARYLRGKGIGPDQLVGVCVKRSLEMVVGLVGILKAGGAYLPLDPNYPAERLQHMLEDAAPRVVLTQKELTTVLPASAAEVIELDEKLTDMTDYGAEDLPPPARGLSSSNLVYVIYTSGSTGLPKGTAMPHRAMVNLIEWHRRNLRVSEGLRVLQFAALSFDVAFQETFSTLCTGGTLVLLDEWVRRDARALMELLSSQSIERLFVPPLMLQALAEHFRTTRALPSRLRDVITAGEQLRISPEIVDFFQHLNGCRLHNHYGPTETHVVTALTLTGNPDEWPGLPTIGQPISNTQMYVLDGQRQPVPLGVTGEIYIGGANVARGYLNRPDLTAERFRSNPFGSNPQERMYKTGDLGRWRADGTLEYLGRNDGQVKIRGYRIELGEIETQLMRHPQVREAAVVVREDVAGEKRLVAYVAQRDQRGPSVEDLRAHLMGVLPEHMVPSLFVTLERLPLTPSGKLNRRALPVPRTEEYASEKYEAPQGEIEQTLAGIWQQLLHVNRVGREDNFFELGGHSLSAMQLAARIQSTWSIEMPVRLLFEFATLQQLSAQVDSFWREHLIDRIADGGTEIDDLLERVAAMPESEVRDLLGELTTDGRP